MNHPGPNSPPRRYLGELPTGHRTEIEALKYCNAGIWIPDRCYFTKNEESGLFEDLPPLDFNVSAAIDFGLICWVYELEDLYSTWEYDNWYYEKECVHNMKPYATFSLEMVKNYGDCQSMCERDVACESYSMEITRAVQSGTDFLYSISGPFQSIDVSRVGKSRRYCKLYYGEACKSGYIQGGSDDGPEERNQNPSSRQWMEDCTFKRCIFGYKSSLCKLKSEQELSKLTLARTMREIQRTVAGLIFVSCFLCMLFGAVLRSGRSEYDDMRDSKASYEEALDNEEIEALMESSDDENMDLDRYKWNIPMPSSQMLDTSSIERKSYLESSSIERKSGKNILHLPSGSRHSDASSYTPTWNETLLMDDDSFDPTYLTDLFLEGAHHEGAMLLNEDRRHIINQKIIGETDDCLVIEEEFYDSESYESDEEFLRDIPLLVSHQYTDKNAPAL